MKFLLIGTIVRDMFDCLIFVITIKRGVVSHFPFDHQLIQNSAVKRFSVVHFCLGKPKPASYLSGLGI